MAIPVASRSTTERKDFCPRCDAPIYTDEGTCHYCHGVHGPNLPSVELMALLFLGVALLGLCAVAAAAP